MQERLQKVLAERGVCARRKAETLITAGRVEVNGRVVNTLGAKVDPVADEIMVDGQLVPPGSAQVYVLLNKPVGVLTACEDARGERTVTDLVDLPQRLYPVGRLDRDSCGLVLLTNDGEMTLRLTHPRYGHEKEYEVDVAAPLGDRQLARLGHGVELEDGMTQPARVERCGPCRFRIVLREGRTRQIRRMCAAVGAEVVRLERRRIENLALAGLAPGAWRHVTGEELELLRKRVYATRTNG
jgi:23S rRNA pseudouridine2605 synthase/23S rRNA pseudouridine2604 synthase